MSKSAQTLVAVILYLGLSGLSVAQTVNLTPAQLFLPAQGAGILTVTLNQPAGADTAVSISASPPLSLMAPGVVIVPTGSISVNFQVTATVDTGTVIVTAMLGSSMSASQVTIGTGRSIIVSPSDVAIPSFGATTLTATLSSPAPAGGLALSVDAIPAGALQTPSVVTVPAGLTSVNFVVTAVVGAAIVTVSVSDGQVSGSTQVTIGTITPAQCQIAVNNAAAAADTYKSKLQLIPPLCMQRSDACTSQVADAAAALSQISKLERTVKASCMRPPR